MHSTTLIGFSLMLGCIPIAFGQINQVHTNQLQFALGACASAGDSASRCVRVGDSTNRHQALRLMSAPKLDPAAEHGDLMTPTLKGELAESNRSSFTSRASLADPALTASPHGWRIGGAGLLNYTATNQRWRFVVGYTPDISALETFSDLHSFNLAWQFSLGKRKPASWAGVKTGTEYLRRPAPR